MKSVYRLFHSARFDGERMFTYTKAIKELVVLIIKNMSKKQYLKALNAEIQKLNGIIDDKILCERSYSREARRHKKLLAELRREEMSRAFNSLLNLFRPSWF
jgi:23S rRNA-/tRNA-specific pseudouridylate synthase